MKKTRKIAYDGLLLALAVAVSAIENLFPLPLGVKPGFSNIIIMYAIIYIGTGSAFSICILKSLFVLMTRGLTAFCMSVSGGILSFMLMLLLFRRTKASLLFNSISGGIAHNMAQLAAACIILKTKAAAAYLPVLIISGCIAGCASGICLRLLTPAFSKLKTTVNKGG